MLYLFFIVSNLLCLNTDNLKKEISPIPFCISNEPRVIIIFCVPDGLYNNDTIDQLIKYKNIKYNDIFAMNNFCKIFYFSFFGATNQINKNVLSCVVWVKLKKPTILLLRTNCVFLKYTNNTM